MFDRDLKKEELTEADMDELGIPADPPVTYTKHPVTTPMESRPLNYRRALVLTKPKFIKIHDEKQQAKEKKKEKKGRSKKTKATEADTGGPSSKKRKVSDPAPAASSVVRTAPVAAQAIATAIPMPLDIAGMLASVQASQTLPVIPIAQ